MYEYGNTRLRAVKSRLLPKSEIEGFASLSNLEELIDSLLGTLYRRSLEEALSEDRGVKAVTRATHFEITHLTNRMRDYYESHAWEMVRLIFQRFDVDNVKAVLRGLENRIPSEEIEQAFGTFGVLERRLLMEIGSADDPREAIDLMASMQLQLAEPLVAYRVEHPGAPLQELEIALERWLIEHSVRVLQKPAEDDRALLEALKMNIDLFNLMLVLRFVHVPASGQVLEDEQDKQAADLLLKHGNLSIPQLEKALEEESVEQAINMFDHSIYEDALANGLQTYRHTGRLSDIERELRRYRLGWMQKQIPADPLGISVPMGVLALKGNECSNIRWVAWGLQMGLPSDEIVEELELV